MTTASTLRQRWLTGHGPIVHRDETAARVEALVARLIADGHVADEATAYSLLAAADRLGCVAMNVVAHMTYARRCHFQKTIAQNVRSWLHLRCRPACAPTPQSIPT